jgi:hypothetical protein
MAATMNAMRTALARIHADGATGVGKGTHGGKASKLGPDLGPTDSSPPRPPSADATPYAQAPTGVKAIGRIVSLVESKRWGTAHAECVASTVAKLTAECVTECVIPLRPAFVKSDNIRLPWEFAKEMDLACGASDFKELFGVVMCFLHDFAEKNHAWIRGGGNADLGGYVNRAEAVLEELEECGWRPQYYLKTIKGILCHGSDTLSDGDYDCIVVNVMYLGGEHVDAVSVVSFGSGTFKASTAELDAARKLNLRTQYGNWAMGMVYRFAKHHSAWIKEEWGRSNNALREVVQMASNMPLREEIAKRMRKG